MQNLTLIGEGATAKIYRRGDHALKLYPHTSMEAIKQEARMQEFACRAGLPVPRIHGISQVPKGILLEMDLIQGEPLIQPKMTRAKLRTAFTRMIELRMRMHSISAESLPHQSERLRSKIERQNILDETRKYEVLSLLNELTGSCNSNGLLCHGDFHALNLLDDGHQIWIIDWVDASCGYPLADVCRSYLIFWQYAKPLAELYLQSYAEAARVSTDAILRWLPIIATARLAENLSKKEIKPLIELAQQHLPCREDGLDIESQKADPSRG